MTRRSARSYNPKVTLQKYALWGLVAVVAVYLTVVAVRAIGASAFFDQRDRMNIVFYGEQAMLVSLGLTDNVHYIVQFDHNDKVSVPGGYGRYRVGALGKLAQIENDPGLVARTFSSMTSSLVDYYVYEENGEVYEDADDKQEHEYASAELIRELVARGVRTNASYIDRAFIAYALSQRRAQDFVSLHGVAQENEEGGTDFSEKRFLKSYKGFFYHQSLREEAAEVKIIYNASYAAAVTMSRVIEGQGIRVVDVAKEGANTRDAENAQEECRIIVSDAGKSRGAQTATYLSRRFGCAIEYGGAEGADMHVVLGNNLSETWK